MYDPRLLDATVDLLESLAAGGNGHALELGIGTGRVALPLAERGVPVTGIDISEPMLDQLRFKPGADNLELIIGSFRTTNLESRFRLVYGVYNVLTTFTTQAEQIEAFENTAAQVEPDGFLLFECSTPDLRGLAHGDRYRAFDVSPAHLGFDEYDIAEQRCTSHHLLLDDVRIVARGESRHRWLWPSELDLLAHYSGLQLHARWSSWTKDPFDSDSQNCISVYKRSSG